MAPVPIQTTPDAAARTPTASIPASKGAPRAIAAFGAWLRRRQRLIRQAQWAVVVFYLTLLVLPAVLPLPARTAHIRDNLTLFAQFVFWGLWWPFVLLSMVLVGRAWCGLLCPEGALSEAASRHGRGRSAPRWLRWRGWPFAAFATTTVYGQMISVYQYPKPAVIILGGSTIAAIAVGYLYGRNKRVWCRYLCPVSGVFGVLARLAPLHFQVDPEAWRAWRKQPGAPVEGVDCAPLVPIRIKEGNRLCHMCARCAGFRGAVTLALRSPHEEIAHVAGKDANPWETALIVFGLIGLAAGAFRWSSSAWLVAVKQRIAEHLMTTGIVWPLEPVLPWWALTNYPAQNDTLTPLDGALLIGYILASSAIIGGMILACLAAAARALGRGRAGLMHHLAQSLIPVAGCGVFLGLSGLTVTMLRAEGVWLGFVPPLRVTLLLGAGLWSFFLGAQILRASAPSRPRLIAAMVLQAMAVAIGCVSWATLYWQIGIESGLRLLD